MSKKTRKTKKAAKRRPLSIRIRGEDLRVDASFSDESLSETLADVIKRASGSTTGPTRTSPGPLADLVVELGKSLRKDQVEVLMNTFDMTQKVLFMEIMNGTGAQYDRAS